MEVTRLWRRRKRAFPDATDGLILSVEAIDKNELTARTVHYRHFCAQQAEPSLYAALKIRPLAVSGIVSIGSAYLFGRRGMVMQAPGTIEFVPSGGVEPAVIGTDGSIDVRAQLLIELAQETGLAQPSGSYPQILGLIEDPRDQVVDVVCGLALDCPPHALFEAHARQGTGEYSELFLVEADQLPAARASWGAEVCPTTDAILASSLCPVRGIGRAQRSAASQQGSHTGSGPKRATRKSTRARTRAVIARPGGITA